MVASDLEGATAVDHGFGAALEVADAAVEIVDGVVGTRAEDDGDLVETSEDEDADVVMYEC